MLSSLDALAGKIAKATPGTGAVAASANGNKPTNNAHHPAHQHHGTRHQLDYDYSAVEIEPPAEQLANSPRSERERLQQAQHAYEQQAQAELEFGLAEVDTKSCLTLLTHRRSSQSMHLLNHSAQAAAAAAAAAAGKSAGNGHARHQQQQQQHYHHPYQRPLRPVSPALQQQHSPPQHQQQQQQQQQSPYQQQLSHLAALQDHHQELLQSQQELFHKQLINLQQQQERERQSAVNYNDSCNSDHDSQHEYKICLRDR